MAGTWMSVVEGFGGMRVRDGKLSFDPFLPEKWQSFSFKVGFRGTSLKVTVRKEQVSIDHLSGPDIKFLLRGREREVTANQGVTVVSVSLQVPLPNSLK